MPREEIIAEADRIMTICNACRYCEGYCAVFPAMERRLSFTSGDLQYLANLCHQCGECYYACQYAPPHEFAVNVPQTLAQLRVQSYQDYAWPDLLGSAFHHNGVTTGLAIAAGLVMMLLLAVMIGGDPGVLWTAIPGADFYAIIPHDVMVTAFGAVALFVVASLGIGVSRFWKAAGESAAALSGAPAWREALSDALSLRYLHGGGEDCTYPGEFRSSARRWLHHLTFYGFMLCFAATCVATIYHYLLGWHAPYPYLSVPKILGTVGGAGLVVGPVGLLWLKTRRDPRPADKSHSALDAGFTVLLILTSVSGLMLMLLRASPALGLLLVLHLGLVMALFLTLPYGKFVHGLYRGAALLKNALEKRRPSLDVAGGE